MPNKSERNVLKGVDAAAERLKKRHMDPINKDRVNMRISHTEEETFADGTKAMISKSWPDIDGQRDDIMRTPLGRTESHGSAVRKRLDKARSTHRGPESRIADLEHTARDLKERIAAGEKGDGIKSPDIHTTLKNVEGELASLKKHVRGK